MERLLIVDDEERIRIMVRKYGEFEGYQVAEANDGLMALDKLKNETFDLVIVDVMMPGLDGFSLCRRIRENSDIPIIILSARGEEYDKIHGFGLGIDDYVTKPFSPKELMLRIEAILARTQKKTKHDIMKIDDLVIDFTSRSVKINHEEVDLSPKETELLFYLSQNRNIALTREQIIRRVWGYDYDGDDRTLDTHIKLLRKKLALHGGRIITLRGVGYRFEDES